MKLQFLAGVAIVAAALVDFPAGAQPAAATLAPVDQRITDEAIQADYQTFEALQARIKALNDGGRRVADYHLAKAQCWLDVSFHEYTRNDRSAFPQDALRESQALIDAMERGVSPLSMETPLVNGAARLRPDLWDADKALEKDPGFHCAEQQVACSEVELVHAGNEFNQQQWRHAKPYVQIAEDLVAQARTQVSRCAPAPAAVPALLASAPAPAPAAAAPAAVELLAHVVFAFDLSDEAAINPASLGPLRQLAGKIASGQAKVDSVRLAGHADRLNGTGDADYNQRLSERRVQTVRDMLVRMGVAADKIVTEAHGDLQPVQACDRPSRSMQQVEDCLLPNRRVEVVVVLHE